MKVMNISTLSLRRYAIIFMIGHFLMKVIYSFMKQRAMHANLDHMPGLRGHWLAGFGFEIKKHMLTHLDWKHRLMDKNSTILLRLPVFTNTSYLLTRDPKLIKHILKDNFDNWSKPDTRRDLFWNYLRLWIGPGIFLSEHGPHAADHGKLWSDSRKIASAIFTKDNFNEFMGNTFRAQAKVFLQVLDKVEEGKTIDMQKMFFAFTMDSIMRIFFGRETRTMLQAEDPYATAYDEAHRSLLAFILKNMVPLGLLDILPFPFGPLQFGQVDGLLAKFYRSFDKDGIQFNKSIGVLHKITDEIIENKVKDPTLKTHRDLISLFLNFETASGESFAHPKHRNFIHTTVLNFIIAGRDTTACTLTWMFFILSTNPEIQKKLCKEIDDVLKGKEPGHDDVSPTQMPYLNAVMYETLRLYPPVPEDIKYALTDDILPDGTKVPAGFSIGYFPYGMGRDPERYPDPLTVKPERWIPFVKPSDFEFPVFQAGPRICLGMKMAILEIKILVSMLLQKYTFTLLEGEKEKIGCSIMITLSLSNSPSHDSHNLWLIPHKR